MADLESQARALEGLPLDNDDSDEWDTDSDDSSNPNRQYFHTT